MLNSEKLKAHFEHNPKDLQALRHDKTLHPARIQAHLKHIPDYLIPKKGLSDADPNDFIPFHKRKRKQSHKRSKHQKRDPLKSF